MRNPLGVMSFAHHALLITDHGDVELCSNIGMDLHINRITSKSLYGLIQHNLLFVDIYAFFFQASAMSIAVTEPKSLSSSPDLAFIVMVVPETFADSSSADAFAFFASS